VPGPYSGYCSLLVIIAIVFLSFSLLRGTHYCSFFSLLYSFFSAFFSIIVLIWKEVRERINRQYLQLILIYYIIVFIRNLSCQFLLLQLLGLLLLLLLFMTLFLSQLSLMMILSKCLFEPSGTFLRHMHLDHLRLPCCNISIDIICPTVIQTLMLLRCFCIMMYRMQSITMRYESCCICSPVSTMLVIINIMIIGLFVLLSLFVIIAIELSRWVTACTYT
jgi:hypothetical protein